MKTYWTCTKFADWIRGTPKPNMGTADEWENWEDKAKQKRFRYWLAEEGLDHLQDFVYWPMNRINDLRCYINNRWITKSHSLVSNLKKGQWYDLDTRLLNSVFDELVNFVEIELAWMQVVFSDEDRKKYKTPRHRTIFRINTWRCAEAGLAYLNWASNLKYDEEWIDKNDPNHDQPTSQALASQEILKLYNWWKSERQNRPDPYEASGWNKYYDEICKTDKADGKEISLSSFLKTSKNDKTANNLSELTHKLKQEQDDEDTSMFIRLIKIRQHLWT